MNAATPATPAVGRLIAGFMIGGITVFAIVAWVLVQRSGPMGDPATADVLRMAWPPVALAAVAAAIVLWRARVTPLLARTPAPGQPDPDGHDSALQTALIIHWALMEGPALFGLVVYLLTAWIPAYAGGLLLGWLGIGLTFPRTGWYRNSRARSSDL